MKKKSLLIITFMASFLLCLTPCVSHAQDVELGAYGKAAQKQYSIANSKIVAVSATADSSAINRALSSANAKASVSSKAMVYIPAGNHKMNGVVNVPANVVMASEKQAFFYGRPGEKMVTISGSVYGGTFDGGKAVRQIFWFNYEKFSNANGEVRKAVIKNATVDGIHYGSSVNRKALGGAKAIGNVITNCHNGITAAYSGSYSLISGNTISKIGTGKEGSGINITHANVSTISNNKISNTKGHGISTETDLPVGSFQRKIVIKTISGNTISNTGTHGIWVDNKVTIKSVKKNTIKKSNMCGIAIEKQGVINALDNNTITGCKQSNITMNGNKSKLTVGSGNIITKSKSIGIMVSGKATLVIKGKNNIIKNNKNDIRVLKSKKAKFKLKNKKKNKIPNIRIV